MKFPFPGTLALKGQIITEEVLIAQKEFEIALTGSGDRNQIGLL